MDKTFWKAESDVWEKFGAITESDNNVVNVFAAQKRYEVLAFNSHIVLEETCRTEEAQQQPQQLRDTFSKTQLSEPVCLTSVIDQ